MKVPGLRAHSWGPRGGSFWKGLDFCTDYQASEEGDEGEGDNHEEKGLVTLYSRSQALGGGRGKDDPGTGDREEALLRPGLTTFAALTTHNCFRTPVLCGLAAV